MWNRSIDKDIGIVEGCVLPNSTLTGFRLPRPEDDLFFAGMQAKIDEFPDRFRVFQIGFSLYERAWTLRGMENLIVDFYDHPTFVHELLESIADYNIAQVKHAWNTTSTPSTSEMTGGNSVDFRWVQSWGVSSSFPSYGGCTRR